jgi:hypothetical protein
MEMPVVSGRECVAVLTQLGFHVVCTDAKAVSLARERAFVEVPIRDKVDDEALWAILRAARLSQLEFLDALGIVSLARIPVQRAS